MLRTTKKTEKQLLALQSQDPGAAVRLWCLRQMMAHRNVSREELVAATGLHRSYISMTLSGYAHLHKAKHAEDWAETIEDGITLVCDRRGYTCKCSDASVQATARLLERERNG